MEVREKHIRNSKISRFNSEFQNNNTYQVDDKTYSNKKMKYFQHLIF